MARTTKMMAAAAMAKSAECPVLPVCDGEPVGPVAADAVPDTVHAPLAQVQKDLAELAASLDGSFLQAGTTLATVIETIDRVMVALDGVTGALDRTVAGAAVHDLGAVADRLARLPEAQGVRAAELSTVAATSKALRVEVMEMHQALHVLRIYGVNIKIAASGAEEFVGFVSGMTATLGVGEHELDAFLATIRDLDASVASAQQGERILAAECDRVVPAVPAALAADAAALRTHLAAVAEAAQLVGSVARDIQARVATVLGALQVGDSTRQRLEHVVTALHILNGHSPHLHTLLIAQIDAIAVDFDRETRLLLAALAALGPDIERLLALIEHDSSEDGRTFLHRLERGITDVESLTSQLHDADQRADAMTDTIATTLEALAARVDTLGAIRLDVQNIAVNTRLMCRRFGDTGKAVSVIATEVDIHTNRLGSALAEIVAPIRALGQVSQAMRDVQHRTGKLDAGRVLAGALDIIRKACRQTESCAREGRDNAQQVIAMIDETSGSLASELALSDGMRRAGAALTAFASPDGPLPEADDPTLRSLLGTIGALYTMAQEREIHAKFLLPGMDPGIAENATADAEDDDDGLF